MLYLMVEGLKTHSKREEIGLEMHYLVDKG